MTKRVLALQHCWDDPPGYLGELLEEHDIACEIVNAEEAPMPNPTGYDAIISLGGPQHAAADDIYPYLAEEKALIRQAVEHDIPFLGICPGSTIVGPRSGRPGDTAYHDRDWFFSGASH